MTAAIVWIVTLLFFAVGLIGTIAPMLPGTPLIFVGVLIYAIFSGFENISITLVVFLGIVAILAQLLDYIAGAYGAKKMGSTRWGVVGSIIGAIIGLFAGNFVGLVLGIFLGAALAELIFAGQDMKKSLKAGWGSILGFLGGTAVKIILGIAMIIAFFWALIF